MKITFSKTAVAVSTLLLLSSVAVAQEQKLGLGVSVAGDNAATIRGTINLDETMRLEPFLGYQYRKIDGANNSETAFTIGTSFHMLQPVSSTVSAYYGGFVAFQNEDNGVSRNTFNLGPVAGVEYAFDPQFTLGAEVRFNLGFGDVSTFGTDSAVVLRYYF